MINERNKFILLLGCLLLLTFIVGVGVGRWSFPHHADSHLILHEGAIQSGRNSKTVSPPGEITDRSIKREAYIDRILGEPGSADPENEEKLREIYGQVYDAQRSLANLTIGELLQLLEHLDQRPATDRETQQQSDD